MMGGVDGCLSSSDRAVGVHQTKVGNHWTTGLCVCVHFTDILVQECPCACKCVLLHVVQDKAPQSKTSSETHSVVVSVNIEKTLNLTHTHTCAARICAIMI